MKETFNHTRTIEWVASLEVFGKIPSTDLMYIQSKPEKHLVIIMLMTVKYLSPCKSAISVSRPRYDRFQFSSWMSLAASATSIAALNFLCNSYLFSKPTEMRTCAA